MLVYLGNKVYICIMLKGGVISLLGRGNTLKYIFRHIIYSANYKFGIFLIVNILSISVLFEYRCFKVDTLL